MNHIPGKKNNWIPLDKELVKYLPKNRAYSEIEAMFSFTLDMDKDSNREISISGYSKLWGWSRNKVRNFFEFLRTGRGQVKDTAGTLRGHPISFIDKALWVSKDTPRTGRGQGGDRVEDTTYNPNPNIDPNKKKKTLSENGKHFPDEVIAIADFFLLTLPEDLQKKVKPETWYDDINKLIMIDKYSVDSIKAVIEKKRKDSFWVTNFLSPRKLRQKNKNGISWMDQWISENKNGWKKEEDGVYL